MGIATQLLPSVAFQHSKGHYPIQLSEDRYNYSLNSMSQDYHQQGIFSFSSNEFERSQKHQQQRQQQQTLHHQIRRDKHRVQGFQLPPPQLVALEENEPAGLPGFENAGLFSEMFNFSSGATTTAKLLENQIQENYRASRKLSAIGGGGSDWYGGRQSGMMGVGSLGPSSDHHQQQHQISSINGDSAAAMQLFLMNPQPKSPSPSPTFHPPPTTSSTLHMLLSNPSTTSTLQGFHTTVGTSSQSPETAGVAAAAAFGGPCSQFTWFPDGTHEGNLNTAAQLNNPNEIGGVVDGQGLSLSLASSLQHIDSTKAEELRMGDEGILFFNQREGSTTPAQYQLKNLLQSGLVQNQQVHVGFGSSLGTANLLRNSKYSKAAQELLEEFCSVGTGQFKKGKFGKNNTNPNSNPSGRGGGFSSSSSKEPPPSLSAADRLEHQRRKVKILSMLDEVDRRYNNYCEQMQMVVNSFDLVMGFAAAIPYTALAQKAMSRHFRCLKDAIGTQLKRSCELLGEKEASTSAVTKRETPRLKMLEKSLRQQRAFHQIAMMEQEAWRPQRGLPERSVNILRAWLFEHFLHPYPSDADKHLLSRQTGLSRNQVSNWFINARVRLWKPMIEEMYEQEIKEEVTTTIERENSQNSDSAQTSTSPTAAAAAAAIAATAERSEMNASESDPSHIAINTHCFSENQANNTTSSTTMSTNIMPISTPTGAAAAQQQFLDMGSKFIRFGTIAGDVSLTLGLRHAGNLQPEKSSFSVRDFGSC